jgi:hypothetical protein
MVMHDGVPRYTTAILIHMGIGRAMPPDLPISLSLVSKYDKETLQRLATFATMLERSVLRNRRTQEVAQLLFTHPVVSGMLTHLASTESTPKVVLLANIALYGPPLNPRHTEAFMRNFALLHSVRFDAPPQVFARGDCNTPEAITAYFQEIQIAARLTSRLSLLASSSSPTLNNRVQALLWLISILSLFAIVIYGNEQFLICIYIVVSVSIRYLNKRRHFFL